MLDEIIKDTETRMGSSVKSAKSEMAGIRAGRASPGMLDSLKVDAYGQKMNINQLANITTPDPPVPPGSDCPPDEPPPPLPVFAVASVPAQLLLWKHEEVPAPPPPPTGRLLPPP